jgi:hypothetical protein
MVVDAFKYLTNEVGHIDMQALSERLNPAWHPQVMAGQMAPRLVMDDMVEGTDLMRTEGRRGEIGDIWWCMKGAGDRGKEENVRVREHRCMADEA